MLPPEAHAFTLDLKAALLRMENTHRKDNKQEPYPEDCRVDIPAGPRCTLRLLNLKIWSMRYCVSLEFILKTLTWIYRRKRVVSNNPKQLSLGLAASVITSPSARIYLEEAVLREYPNGENYRAAHQPTPPLPDIEMVYEGMGDFVEKYSKAMEANQRALARVPRFRRNFRS